MGWLNNFFSGGGSESKSTNYIPKQKEWLESLLDLYGGQVGTGQASYEGTRVAPLTDVQQSVLGSLGNWSQYLTPQTNTPLNTQTGAALSDLMAGEMGAEPYTEEAVNQLFKSAYEAPAMKTWSEYIKPEIQEAYSGPGYWSTARMNAVAEGAQDVADTLASQYGQLRWDTETANKALEEAQAGRALSAIPLATEYNAQPLTQALQALSGTGALYGLASAGQQQSQAEIAASMEKWAEENQITNPAVLQTMLSLLGLQYETKTERESGAGLGYGTASNFFNNLGNAANAGWSQMLG